MTQNYLNHCGNDPDLRLKSRAFTRKRKLTAKRILMILLHRLAYSLRLENFSGKTEVSVRQDFYATIYIAGFALICAADATKIIEDIDREKALKYARKARPCLKNRARSSK